MDFSVDLARKISIFLDLAGTLETVRGRGVMGAEPELNAFQPAFQYSSHVSLQVLYTYIWGQLFRVLTFTHLAIVFGEPALYFKMFRKVLK